MTDQDRLHKDALCDRLMKEGIEGRQECIYKNIEILNRIDRTITAEDSEENLYVCDECKEKIK